MSLEDRIAIIEAESAIRKLKAEYLNACDRKDPESMRSCFTKEAFVEYPPLGEFDVDGLIELFTTMAVKTNIIDAHQGFNAEISVNGDKAEAVWGYSYSMFNPDDESFRFITGFYHDRYERANGEWLISYSKTLPRRIFDGQKTKTGLQGHLVGG